VVCDVKFNNATGKRFKSGLRLTRGVALMLRAH
jgi:hypothetical protein